MADLKTELRCRACERSFSVELTTMRFNFQHTCPFCGSAYRVSEEEAIRAHRALDEIEHMRKCAWCVTGRAAPLEASARLGKCFYFSAFPAVIGNDVCEVI